LTEYLASWKSGAAKQAILDFVEASTTPGPGFAAPADRIATFDNDGTLWVEKPAPPQADFLVRAWTKAARDDPSLGSRQPYKAIIEQDMGYFQGLVTQDPDVVASLEGAVAETWAGTTPDVFDAEVRNWVETVTRERGALGGRGARARQGQVSWRPVLLPAVQDRLVRLASDDRRGASPPAAGADRLRASWVRLDERVARLCRR